MKNFYAEFCSRSDFGTDYALLVEVFFLFYYYYFVGSVYKLAPLIS